MLRITIQALVFWVFFFFNKANSFASLLAGISRRLLSGWVRGITTTFVSMTLKRGLTTPDVLLVTMRHPTSMSSQLVWLIVVPVSESHELWARRSEAILRIAVPLLTATRML